MSIKDKLIYFPVITLLLLLTIVSVFWYGLHYLDHFTQHVRTYERQSMYLEMMLRGANETLLTEGTPTSVNIARQGIDGFDAIHHSILDGKDAEHPMFIQHELNRVAPLWDEIRSMLGPFLVVNRGGVAQEEMVRYGKLLSKSDELKVHIDKIKQDTRAARDNAEVKVWVMIAVLVTIIILCMLLLFYNLYSSIGVPINRLRDIMTNVSEERGQIGEGLRNRVQMLSQHVVSRSGERVAPQNEIDGLTVAFTNMIDSVDENIGKREKVQAELNELNKYLEKRVDDRTRMLNIKQEELEKELQLHKKMERELEKARDEAMAAARMKSQFLANMSHEIRTPMNGIIGMLSLMESTELSEEQTHYIHMAVTAGNQLLVLINDILDLSKIDAGKLELESVAVDLPLLMKEESELLRLRADEKGVELRCTVADEVPKSVYTDPVRITQVVVNLVNNAVKFTESGTIDVSLSVDQCINNIATLCLEIVDTGIGMSTDMLEHIFEAFTQADGSTTRIYGGTGLGLTITRQLVDLMGGSIGIESTLGSGTTVTVHIPFRVIPETDDVTHDIHSAREYLSTELPPTGAARVLVVEDNELNRYLLATILDKLHLPYELAENGLQAVELLISGARGRFDLVLMDCQMPVMDGFSASKRIRASEEQGEHIPIIAVTALAMKGDSQKCLAAGMDDYMTKPISFPVLQQKITHWMQVIDARRSNGQ